MASKWVYAFDEVAAAQRAVGGEWDEVRACSAAREPIWGR